MMILTSMAVARNSKSSTSEEQIILNQMVTQVKYRTRLSKLRYTASMTAYLISIYHACIMCN